MPRLSPLLSLISMPNTLESLCAMLSGTYIPSQVDARKYLQAFLTAKPTSSIPDDAWPLLDELWRQERSSKDITSAKDLALIALPGAPQKRFSLWRGDITALECGAIVNAANSGLTGCYQPFHACVDNAIHTASGPRLRLACEEIMSERGRPEPTGTATVTPAFHLPSRYVIHTVGPIVPDHNPNRLQQEQLVDCYRSCILAAAEIKAESIAFCSISTGVFGYPKQAAAELSLRIIAETVMALEDRAPHVVVVAYSQLDEDIYQGALEAARRIEV